MRCFGCQYDLSNLSGHRCPECGRAFDPNDPRTFLSGAMPWRFLPAVQVILIAFLFADAVMIIIDFEPFRPDWLGMKYPGRVRYLTKLGIFGVVAFSLVTILRLILPRRTP